MDYAYHGRIEKCVVEVGVGSQQLAPQVFRVLDVVEEGDLHRIGLVVRQRERPYRGHGVVAAVGERVIVQSYLFSSRALLGSSSCLGVDGRDWLLVAAVNDAQSCRGR